MSRYATATFSYTFENDELWRLKLNTKGVDDFSLPLFVFENIKELYETKYGKSKMEDDTRLGDFVNSWSFENMEIRLIGGKNDCVIIYTDLEAKRRFEEEQLDTSDL
ncbi:MAG: hypothetical protein ACPG21_12165 [Crocinitomicaceae bacterium]